MESPSKAMQETCDRWYLKGFQDHMTDHLEIILDDPSGPSNVDLVWLLLGAQQILMPQAPL